MATLSFISTTSSRRSHTIKAFSAPTSSPLLAQDDLKKLAADKAVEYVKSGMVLGLGTGFTAAFVVTKLGEILSSGELTNIVGVLTSKCTQEQAAFLNISLSTLDDHPKLDLAIDGADEVDRNLDLVKGRGGVLLREKMVEAKLRLDGDKPYGTDNSNYIVDLYFKTPIKHSSAAGKEISAFEGVVEHGLFLDMATAVIIARKEGVSVKSK